MAGDLLGKEEEVVKGKNRDKVALQVLMDADAFERMGKEVPEDGDRVDPFRAPED